MGILSGPAALLLSIRNKVVLTSYSEKGWQRILLYVSETIAASDHMELEKAAVYFIGACFNLALVFYLILPSMLKVETMLCA